MTKYVYMVNSYYCTNEPDFCGIYETFQQARDFLCSVSDQHKLDLDRSNENRHYYDVYDNSEMSVVVIEKVLIGKNYNNPVGTTAQ